MILADKIISLRKKAGWSQEELAQQLGVSRQSVSKWEGAQSVPDLDRILQLSRLFGVTTDDLLKDEIEEFGPAAESDEPALRRVTMEQSAQYLVLRRKAAPQMALATLLCVLSPIPLLMLAALSEKHRIPLTEEAAAGLGLCALIVLVAVAVTLFLLTGAKSCEYAFLENMPFETEYGVSGMVREREKAFRPAYTRLNIAGTLLCLLSVLPVFATLTSTDLERVLAVCLLLAMAGFGAAAFTYGGTIHASMEKLLEEGDYTRVRKARGGLVHTVCVCYWLVVTAIYLLITFSPAVAIEPEQSWFVWPVAGVLFGAVCALTHLFRSENK